MRPGDLGASAGKMERISGCGTEIMGNQDVEGLAVTRPSGFDGQTAYMKRIGTCSGWTI